MRKTLSQISHLPTPTELYDKLMQAKGWPYKTETIKFLTRDRALVSLLYLGDFREIEVLPLTPQTNFQDMKEYLWVKDVIVGKKRKLEYREAKLPYKGERKIFTQLVTDYLAILKPTERLFPFSLEKIKVPIKGSYYTLKDGTVKQRYSTTLAGTKRIYQIVHVLLPNDTAHWLRAFGYNFDYDNMNHDIMAVSDKTKADAKSLQNYIRRRYEKYPVR